MSDGLSFDLALDHPGFALRMAADLPGQGITALVGPSGAGKTTLLQAIAGLEPARGHVTLDARALHPLPTHRRGVAVVFQNARLFGHLDVAGNIVFGAKRRGTDAATVDRIVAALDLGPLMGRAVTRLSGGETRRVALARALAASPDLLLLDEPLSGLDPARRTEILPYLARAIRTAGCPALFVTHDDAESLALADRRLAVRDGRIAGPLPAPALLPLDPVTGDSHSARLGDLKIPTAHEICARERWALVLDPGRAFLALGDAPVMDAVAIPAIVTNVLPDELELDALGTALLWPVPDGASPRPDIGDKCQLLSKRSILRLLSVDK